jgi:uncharacterized membrane protein YjdF
VSAARTPADHQRYLLALAVLFAAEWVALAIRPRYWQDWALENALTVAFVVALILLRHRLRLSRISYTALFVFLSLHTVGAHYTYSEVPYDEWTRALTGYSVNELFGWQRNHYDRFVHFAYGLLFAYPIRETLIRLAGIRVSGPITCRSPSPRRARWTMSSSNGAPPLCSAAILASPTSARRGTSGMPRRTWRWLPWVRF